MTLYIYYINTEAIFLEDSCISRTATALATKQQWMQLEKKWLPSLNTVWEFQCFSPAQLSSSKSTNQLPSWEIIQWQCKH